MSIKKHRSFWPAVIILLLFLPGCNKAVAKAAQDDNVIRVAYPIQAKLTEIDENGVYSGYTYEYLQEIAQYTGWTYEFVTIPGDIDESLSKMMEMLANGEIDLMGGMLYSQALNEQYHYTGYHYGIVETVLQIPIQDTRDIIIDSQIEQKMVIAVNEKASRFIEETNEYCKMNLIEPEYLYCTTDEEVIEAVKSGRADVMVNSSANYIEGMKVIAGYAQKPFYFITTLDDERGLVGQLNAALLNIRQMDPDYSSKLYEQYFGIQNTEIPLSDRETAYIKAAGVLKVGFVKQFPPFQYTKTDTSELQGISLDVLEYISEKTGLAYELVPVRTNEELKDMLENGRIDIAAGIEYDLDKRDEIAMTRPYITSQYVLILNKALDDEKIDNDCLALVRGSIDSDLVLREEVSWYDTLDECIEAVNKGEADFTYLNAYSSQHYINHTSYTNLHIVPQAMEDYSVCFGINRDNSWELLSLLNKTILYLPRTELESIIYKNTVYKPRATLEQVIRENPFEFSMVVSGILLIIIGILSYSICQRIKMNKKTALDLKKHLQVYELVNDYFVEYDYKTKELIISNPNDLKGQMPGFLSAASEHVKEQEDVFLPVICGQEDGVKELCLKGADGEMCWISLAIRTVYDDTGAPAYTIGKIKDINEEKREKETLIEQARRDSLTRLYNVKAARQKTKLYMKQLKAGEQGVLILLDIDYFKDVNDHYGHMRGDEVLTELAGLLNKIFKEEDIKARPGGDEFLVYIRSIEDEEAVKTLCRLLCEGARNIYLDEEKHLTLSVGAAFARPGDDYDTVFKKADKALYRAKETGRDCFETEF